MGNFDPSDEQKEFLKDGKYNVLVSASAGSGKTSTMIQKLLMLLDQYKFPISSLLVVTFTNSAGAEIRQRLYIAMSEHLATLTNPKDKEYFQKQLENIGNAEIGTLHAICKKLIVKYFYAIEQSPDFKLIVDKETEYLFDSAIESVFRKHIVSGDTEFFELYNSYNSDRNDTNLRGIIKSLHNYAGSKPDYKDWLKTTTEDSYNLNLNENKACKFVLHSYIQKFLDTKEILEELREEAGCLGLEKCVEYLSTWLQFVDEVSKAQLFEQALKIFNNFSPPRKPTKSKKASVDEEVFDEKLELCKKLIKGIYDDFEKDLIHTDYDKIVEDLSYAKQNLDRVITICDEVEDTYSKFKKDKNVVDFNDLEFLMLKILEDEKILNELKEHYKFVFFDEYQDINEKQELILSKLTSGDNYYMIGDVKQSIYAFRQASPKIFISKFQKFYDDGEKNKLIMFNKNYRSEKNILEYCNQVFDALITNDTIGVDYKKTARFVSDKSLDGGRVKLTVLNTFESKNNKVDAEAVAVANEIVSLMQKTKADGTRFNYSDIAIILRSRGDLAYSLFKTLTDLQIPVSTEIESEFFDAVEIMTLISILKVLSNYKDDLSVATTLKVLFGFSDDELIGVRESVQEKYFYNCVLMYNKNDEIMTKIQKFLDFIEHYKIYLSTHTLSETIWDIVDKFNLLLYYKSMPKGIERENNILEFVSFANNENYKYSLDKFIEYIDFASKNRLKQTIGTKGNAVQIITIHASKGLEYPAVILCGLGRQIRTNAETGNLITSNAYGVGLKSISLNERVVQETIVRKACKLYNYRSEFDEEIRLLYVAMTRPREYLRLVGTYDLEKIEENYILPIYSSSSMLDMIFKSYSKSDINKISHAQNLVLNEGEVNESRIEVIAVDDIQTSLSNIQNDIVVSSGSENLSKRLSEIYSNPPSTQTFTIKNTVTNILRDEVDYENLISSPKHFNVSDRVDGVDALKLGTAYHSVMQRVNFNESKEDIEGLIDGLIGSNEIMPELKNHIKIDEILDACRIVGAMLKDAKKVYKEKQFLMQECYNKLVKNSDNKTRVIVQGVIDLVIQNENEVILVDYKTNKTSNPNTLVEEYSMQLKIYARAFELATGIKINKMFLYSFYQHRLIEVK